MRAYDDTPPIDGSREDGVDEGTYLQQIGQANLGFGRDIVAEDNEGGISRVVAALNDRGMPRLIFWRTNAEGNEEKIEADKEGGFIRQGNSFPVKKTIAAAGFITITSLFVRHRRKRRLSD